MRRASKALLTHAAAAGPVDYSASKAAVINMARTCAFGLGGTDIRVNAINPGLIATGMTKPLFEMAIARGKGSKIGQVNPTRRYAVPEEIAQAVVFLASDEASYVNGIELPVDGGLVSSVFSSVAHARSPARTRSWAARPSSLSSRCMYTSASNSTGARAASTEPAAAS